MVVFLTCYMLVGGGGGGASFAQTCLLSDELEQCICASHAVLFYFYLVLFLVFDVF